MKEQEGDIVQGLIFLKEMPRNKHNQRRAVFLCHCGTEFETLVGCIRAKIVVSCGCAKRVPKTHGMSYEPEYGTYNRMIGRCYNQKSDDYKDYGGRGIIVCDRWKNDIQTFFDDMGRRPSKIHSLDRIDVNGNYEPENCKWSDQVEQACNRRSSNRIEYKGVIKNVFHWGAMYGVRGSDISYRMRKGLSFEGALNEAVKSRMVRFTASVNDFVL